MQPIVKWQYEKLEDSMGLLEDHLADPDCPCHSAGENCARKHLKRTEAYAQETMIILSRDKNSPQKEFDQLVKLAEEAKQYRRAEESLLCGKKVKDTDLCSVSWASSWRKYFETLLVNACHIAVAHDSAPEIKVSGKCGPKAKSCKFKVTAVSKTEAETASIQELSQLINQVSRKAQATASPLTWATGTNTNKRYELEFKIVDAEKLKVSNDPFTFAVNPDYPAELQPRNRDRAATRLQVQRMAANLDPAALIDDYHSIDRGAPIVGPDMVVESGNGRVMSLILSSKQFPDVFARYLTAMVEKAQVYGLEIDKKETGYKIPVMVRIRLSEVDRKKFVEEANASTVIETSSIEKAHSDAKKITTEMLIRLSMREGENIEDALRSSRNAAFVRAFVNKLPANEQAAIMDTKGMISQAGILRITMALFMATFKGKPGERLAEMFFESTDISVRTIFNGILRSLGQLSQSEAAIAAGDRDPEYSIGEDLAKTVSVYAGIKKTPSYTVQKYIQQLSMLDRELNKLQEDLLLILDKNARSARRISDILSSYAQGVLSMPPSNQAGLIPGIERPSKAQLLAQAVRLSELSDVDIMELAASACEIPSAKYRYLADMFYDDFNVTYLGDLSAPSQEKERKIDIAMAKLEEGIQNIIDSDNFQQYLKTLGKFHNYSLGNLILITLQKPDAARVAGFNTWKDIGRNVKAGSHGIMILAPCFSPKKKKSEVPEDEDDEQDKKEVVEKPVYFKVVYVFDISQTEGRPLVDIDVPVIEGESSRELFNAGKSLSASYGLKITADPVQEMDPETMGYFYPAQKEIWIRKNPIDQMTKTLYHEIAHSQALDKYGRDGEVLAESVAFAVCSHFGFDTGVRSFPYVALWAKDIKVLKQNLDRIRKLTDQIVNDLESLGFEKVIQGEVHDYYCSAGNPFEGMTLISKLHDSYGFNAVIDDDLNIWLPSALLNEVDIEELADDVILPVMMSYAGDWLSIDDIKKKARIRKISSSKVIESLEYLEGAGEIISRPKDETKPQRWTALRSGEIYDIVDEVKTAIKSAEEVG